MISGSMSIILFRITIFRYSMHYIYLSSITSDIPTKLSINNTILIQDKQKYCGRHDEIKLRTDTHT